jgi:hypothetical protein
MFSGLIARPLGHQYDHGSPNHHAATCEVLEIAREEKIFEEKPRRSASHKCISTLSMHLEMMPGCRYRIATPSFGNTSMTTFLPKFEIGRLRPGSRNSLRHCLEYA